MLQRRKAYAIQEIGDFSNTVIAVCEAKETVLNAILNQLAGEYGARDYYEDIVDDGKEVTFMTINGDVELKITETEYFSNF